MPHGNVDNLRDSDKNVGNRKILKNGGLKINLPFRIDFIAGYSIFWYNRFMGLRMSLDNSRIKLSNRIL